MDNTVVLSSYMKCISHLITGLRDEKSDKLRFKRCADRIMTLLCEEGLAHVDSITRVEDVSTPTRVTIPGTVLDTSNVVAVSIIRAGDSMLDCFLQICPEASVGKILIQRDEATALPVYYYHKLPPITGRPVILLDPMLATGGSACAAIRLLLEKGAVEENIVFFCVISCPEGIAKITTDFPKLRIVTAQLDDGLNERSYIMPGLGDYGDRYFGTA